MKKNIVVSCCFEKISLPLQTIYRLRKLSEKLRSEKTKTINLFLEDCVSYIAWKVNKNGILIFFIDKN